MEQSSASTAGPRRNEDIALDLLKFVASTAGIGRAASTATGFGAGAASRPDDQVDHLLGLYTRCLQTVQGK